jgi:hypothetical protein
VYGIRSCDRIAIIGQTVWRGNDFEDCLCLRAEHGLAHRETNVTLSFMTLSDAKDVTIIVGGVIGIFTFVKGVHEYILQGKQKRAEQIEKIEETFSSNQLFFRICDELDNNDVALRNLSFQEKLVFLSFFERIALMVNSGMIRSDVAHNMFGYYVIKCWQSENFWEGLERDSIYWSLYKDFVQQMKATEDGFNSRCTSMGV